MVQPGHVIHMAGRADVLLQCQITRFMPAFSFHCIPTRSPLADTRHPTVMDRSPSPRKRFRLTQRMQNVTC